MKRIIISITLAIGAVVPVICIFSGSSDERRKDGNKPLARGVAAASPAMDLLEGVIDETLSADSLSQLRSELHSMEKVRAVEVIRSFLRGGRDRSTGMEFEISDGGNLKSWPTLRVFLLDVVAAIDPAAAMEISREILAKPTSADEWALALRNIGRSGRTPDSDAFLRIKTSELIHNPAWQSQPSIGYFQAFDLLVHTEATSESPLLSSMIQRGGERKDLAHAAFLTLDRLVQRKPADMLQRLSVDTALRESHPEMAAQQFARADLRDPAQKVIVERWLLDPTRTSRELHAFAGVFPNQNRFVSKNLLTNSPPVSEADLAALDREVLSIIRHWQTAPGFLPVKRYLDEMEMRLGQFTAPGRGGEQPIHPSGE